MKALAIVGAVVAMAVLGLVALLRLTAAGGGTDHAALSQEVTAQVVASERAATRPGRGTSGHDVRVRYEVVGRWYAVDGYVPDSRWSSGSPTLTVCVDPDDPRTAVVPGVSDVTVTCGADYLGGNDPQRARPTSGPTP